MNDRQSSPLHRRSSIRFSLAQMLMAIGLVAILLAFFQCDGCGAHLQKISCLEFSADGKRLAVARHDARDALVSMKFYLRDVSRTVSLFEVPSLRLSSVVEQKLLRGDRGPAFGLFSYAGQSVAFSADSQFVVVRDFEDGEVNRYECKGLKKEPLFTQSRAAINLEISPDRSLLAVGHPEGVDLYDSKTRTKVKSISTDPEAFIGAPLIAISADNSLLATYGYDGAKIWDARSGNQLASVERRDGHGSVRNLAFSPRGSVLAIAFSNVVNLYQLDGKETGSLATGAQVLCARFSNDGRNLAVGTRDGVEILDVESGERIHILTGSNPWVRCIEFSPDGNLLAASVAGRYVKLWDMRTGELLATARPPGRYRPPWTLPAALLVIWGVACWWLNRRGCPSLR